MTDTTPTTDRNGLAALLAHHADVLAARWYAVAPGPGAWEVAAALALRDHASDLTAEKETPFVREFLDSVMEYEADRARQVCGTTDQQPETVLAGTELRDRMGRYLEAIRVAVAPRGPWGPEHDAAAVAAMAVADEELAVQPAPADQTAEFELRGDTEIRAAAFREAADFVGNDDRCECGGCDSCVPNKLAAGLRRMADEGQQVPPGRPVPAFVGSVDNGQPARADLLNTFASWGFTTRFGSKEAADQVLAKHRGEVLGQADEAQQPTTAKAAPLATPCNICGHTLNWHRNEGGCSVHNCYCRSWQQPTADEAQQPETEARPAETEWVVESLFRNSEWRAYYPARHTRDEAQQDYIRAVDQDADHQYRIVRVATTYTVEPTTTEA